MKTNFALALMLAAVMSSSAFAKDGNRGEGAYSISAATEQKTTPMVTEEKQNSAPSAHHAMSEATPFGGWNAHHQQAASNDVNKMENPNVSIEASPLHHARSQNIPFGGWVKHHQQ
ncbi:hypothetical protein WAE56_19850 [Iodobacter sp. LRB]|uniref:hypothetical protein n=1 Tax=unclassified Iodobacter TaxID=235634 RepID=UPI000C11C472|nr:hypothetical protein [Iodobacter sp. BJB302]PHV00174.1 hypothetical protein CSQ88_18575 [Iodobacter sp. BJB302]